MRFTVKQYDAAIEALQSAKTQLEPDGDNCHVCGDSGHQAFECGHNPLLAMSYCEMIASQSGQLHEILHYLAGHEFRMGEPLGPARIVVPPPEPPAQQGSGTDDFAAILPPIAGARSKVDDRGEVF